MRMNLICNWIKRNIKLGFTILNAIFLLIWILFLNNSQTPDPPAPPSVPLSPITKDFRMLAELGSRNASVELKSKLKVHIAPSNITNTEYDVLIVIMSTPEENSEGMRQVIRDLYGKWASRKEFSFRFIFYIGLYEYQSNFINKLKDLKNESESFGDLLVIDLVEGYYRLPLKILRLFEWFSRTFQHGESFDSFEDTLKSSFISFPISPMRWKGPNFLMRADQDLLLNIPKLLKLISSEETQDKLKNPGYFVAGNRLAGTSIITNPGSKYWISADFWLNGSTKYPDYLSGSCYVVSANLPRLIFKGSLEVPLFPLDDVYITGMVMGEKLGLLKTYTDFKDLSKQEEKLKKDVEHYRKSLYLHGAKNGNDLLKLKKSLEDANAPLVEINFMINVLMVISLSVFYVHSIKELKLVGSIKT